MTWATFLAAFAAALLSGLGVGSAGLFVTYLVFVKKLSQIAAQGLNLVFYLCSSAAALAVHLFRTPLLVRCALFLIPFGLIGSFVGARFATALPQALLRRMFGILLIATGAVGLLSRRQK